MRWRFIPAAVYSAEENMAIDESILHHVSSGHVPPTIRFYRWIEPGAISMAYSQRADDVILDKVPAVRRPTGGRAVFHGPHDFTYAVIVPESVYPEFLQSYFEMCQWIIDGLKEIGIYATFDNSTSLLVNGKKISGNAQVRKEGTILQHGTVFYTLPNNLPDLFKIPSERRDAFLSKITSVKKEAAISSPEMFSYFETSFLKNKDVVIGQLTDEEKRYAQKLLKEKYGTKEWLLGTQTEMQKGDCHSQWEEKPERATIFLQK